MNTTHGYARCSTNETRQDIERQVRELKTAGATQIWTDYEHGDAIVKDQQVLMLESVSEGDTIIVTEVSRLARSVRQLCGLIDQIRDRHLRLIIIGSITMDCRSGSPDPMTEAFLQIAGVFSQLELAMIRGRVKSGMANARAKGKRIGRPPTTLDDIPDSFLRYYVIATSQHMSVVELARLSGLSRPTVYKYVDIINKKRKVIKNDPAVSHNPDFQGKDSDGLDF